MFILKNLSIQAEDKSIIKDLSLKINSGELHVLMGPNGSGKSTLAYTIMGHYKYQVNSGQILFKEHDITNLSPDKRVKLGLFLACQYPQEIPGVQIFGFLKEAYQIVKNQILSVSQFKDLITEIFYQVGLDSDFIYRYLNENFSGGEKKRLEIAQLLLFKPDFAILDEIDSGLDVDALKLVCTVIGKLREENPKFSVLLITHYMRVLEYLTPDKVHVLHNGQIIKSGDISIAQDIEQKGYSEISL